MLNWNFWFKGTAEADEHQPDEVLEDVPEKKDELDGLLDLVEEQFRNRIVTSSEFTHYDNRLTMIKHLLLHSLKF